MKELSKITEVKLTPTLVKRLHEYSTTLPTGVYPGKMWRRQVQKGDDLPFGAKVPGLKGKWVIGSYFPKDKEDCTLTWLPIVVMDEYTIDITEHCYNEECYYLSFNQGGIDDEHHSPNCRGALLRRAIKAEKALGNVEKHLREHPAPRPYEVALALTEIEALALHG